MSKISSDSFILLECPRSLVGLVHPDSKPTILSPCCFGACRGKNSWEQCRVHVHSISDRDTLAYFPLRPCPPYLAEVPVFTMMVVN